MSYSVPPEKMKNDMPPHYPKLRERGGCLTAFLGWAIFVNGLALVGILALSNEIRNSPFQVDSTIQFIIFILFVIQVGVFISAVGLWNWKRWGYHGLQLVFGAGVVLNLCGGDIFQAIMSAVNLGILVKLVGEVEHNLE